MEIKVMDEPDQAVATVSPSFESTPVQTMAAVEAPPAPTPTFTEPAVPPPAPDPLPESPEPVSEPSAPTTGSDGAVPPISPLNRTPMPTKKSKPMMVVIIAVIVVLAIAAAMVFAYMRSRDKTVPTPAVSTTAPVVTASDVNSTSQEIDKSLKSIDDSKDFSSNDISDTTLGL